MQTACKQIPDRMGWALTAVFFGFLPVGLVALYYSVCVASRLRAGHVDAALRCSKRARIWIWTAFIAQLTAVFVFICCHGRA